MVFKSCSRLCLIIMLCAAKTVFAQSADPKNYAGDTALKHWLNQNIKTNPSVVAAEAALDAASYQTVAAGRALYNPELEINAENAETRYRSIGISQTIDWGNTRSARTRMATAGRLAARFELEATRQRIAVELLDALAKYHTSTSLESLVKQGEALMQHFAKLAKRRFKAGDLGQVEVDLANLSYAQARFKLADAISENVRTRQKLMALVGHAETRWPAFIADFPDPLFAKENIDKTVQALPRMRAITARVATAQAKINVRAGESSVNPTIAVRAGKEDQHNLLGITLSIPLQLRNNFKAEIDVANAEMIQAESESMDAYRKLKSRLEIAGVSYDLSRKAWLAWEASGAGSLKQQIKLLERLWRAGELSTTDYLVQLKQALDTRAGAIKQRGRMWTNWSEWLLASGKIKHWLQTTTNTGINK